MDEGTTTATLEAVPDGPADLHPRTDFFGTVTKRVPIGNDGVSYIEVRKFAEGEKRRYLNETNRDVTVSQKDQSAKLKLAPGDDRAALLKAAIVGWDLMFGGNPLPFSDHTLRAVVLEKIDPVVLDKVIDAIHELNPWLNADITIEQIDEQIERLTELRATKVAEEEGKASS